MMETIAVCLIVGIVGILSVRSLHRTFTGKNGGCGCAGNSRSCGKVCASAGMQAVPGEGKDE